MSKFLPGKDWVPSTEHPMMKALTTEDIKNASLEYIQNPSELLAEHLPRLDLGPMNPNLMEKNSLLCCQEFRDLLTAKFPNFPEQRKPPKCLYGIPIYITENIGDMAIITNHQGLPELVYKKVNGEWQAFWAYTKEKKNESD